MKFWLGVLLVLLLLVGVKGWRDGRLHNAESKRLRHALDSLAAVSARIDTVYASDTVRLWRNVKSVDTMTVTVHSWKHDTLKVVEYVERADSAVRACVAVVLTCEARVALRDTRIALLDSLNANTAKRLRAAKGARWRDAALALGAGYLVGRLAP